MSKREDIIEAAKALLWEKGYEATSPRDIQARSDAGQGSFYHHFPSKQELARVAIEEIVQERIDDFESAMNASGGFAERLLRYVAQNQQPMLGCRVGRLVWDSAVTEEELRAPLERYFSHLERRLIEILDGEQKDGRLRLAVPARQLALIILATVQGSFAISRAMGRSRADDTQAALRKLLASTAVKT
ncbi:TetR/AcrR family transcriptional regulator [Burkholderia cenocepacia]|uniref:TetR/AcrR family transcriptional regulator n=1 Tax=Burkholderia cenocepacia TaxID=95486 RepID=UPI0028632DDA|nr:TetR/AcrR family transcriptional regulator [Burkholderia cenocepacia]MDR5644424.1 TetR/AcrR family transcriptional regulator [Burkholderia cenocepacia]